MAATIATGVPVRAAKPWYRVLYIQVLIAIVLGALFGWLAPAYATNDWVKALGDGFIKLIKMVIAPIIFCTVVSGISHIQDAKKVGRIGVKALVYFEIVSTFALMIGLIVGNVVKVIDPRSTSSKSRRTNCCSYRVIRAFNSASW